jgi:hypothetical protein
MPRSYEAHETHELLCKATLHEAPMAGWLTKLGGERRSWRQRFVLLTSVDPTKAQLRYYTDESFSYLYAHVPSHRTASHPTPSISSQPIASHLQARRHRRPWLAS